MQLMNINFMKMQEDNINNNTNRKNSKVANTNVINKFDLVDPSFITNFSPNKRNKATSVSVNQLPIGSRISAPNVDLGIKIELSSKKSNKIKYSYDSKEIISVFFHMKFLKQLEIPEEMTKEKFLPAVMSDKMKLNLESIKNKIVERARSKTVTELAYKPKRCKFFIFLFFYIWKL